MSTRALPGPALVAGAFAAYAVLSASTGSALAGKLVVPSDYGTLQEAVDAATAGDEIVLKKGTYAEDVVIAMKSDLTIRAEGQAKLVGDTGVALTIVDSSQIVLSKLRIQDSPGDAIRVETSSFVTVEKCRIDRAGGAGIVLVDSTDVTVAKNRLKKITGDGIRAEGGSQHDVEKNRVQTAGLDGIALSTGSMTTTDGCVLRKNRLYDCGDDGIDVNGSENTLEKNDVRRPEEDGIEIDEDGTGRLNVLVKNQVRDSGVRGIVLGGSENVAQENRVFDAKDDGIVCSGTGEHQVVDNEVHSPAFDGVWVLVGSNSCLVSRNMVMKPKDDGVDIEAQATVVSENQVKKAKDNGFEVNATANVLSGNVAKKSGGFDAFDDAGGNTYVDNDFDTTSGI